ncbi:Histone acetyltransferase kat6b [Sarracenia purpurea var. burkii]
MEEETKYKERAKCGPTKSAINSTATGASGKDKKIASKSPAYSTGPMDTSSSEMAAAASKMQEEMKYNAAMRREEEHMNAAAAAAAASVTNIDSGQHFVGGPMMKQPVPSPHGSDSRSMGVYTPDSTTNSVHSVHGYGGQYDMDAAHLNIESPNSISSNDMNSSSGESITRPPSTTLPMHQMYIVSQQQAMLALHHLQQSHNLSQLHAQGPPPMPMMSPHVAKSSSSSQSSRKNTSNVNHHHHHHRNKSLASSDPSIYSTGGESPATAFSKQASSDSPIRIPIIRKGSDRHRARPHPPQDSISNRRCIIHPICIRRRPSAQPLRHPDRPAVAEVCRIRKQRRRSRSSQRLQPDQITTADKWFGRITFRSLRRWRWRRTDDAFVAHHLTPPPSVSSHGNMTTPPVAHHLTQQAANLANYKLFAAAQNIPPPSRLRLRLRSSRGAASHHAAANSSAARSGMSPNVTINPMMTRYSSNPYGYLMPGQPAPGAQTLQYIANGGRQGSLIRPSLPVRMGVMNVAAAQNQYGQDPTQNSVTRRLLIIPVSYGNV